MSAAPWLLLQGQHILELLDSEDDLLDFNALVRRQKTVNYFPLLFKISMLNALTQRRLMWVVCLMPWPKQRMACRKDWHLDCQIGKSMIVLFTVMPLLLKKWGGGNDDMVHGIKMVEMVRIQPLWKNGNQLVIKPSFTHNVNTPWLSPWDQSLISGRRSGTSCWTWLRSSSHHMGHFVDLMARSVQAARLPECHTYLN